MQENSNQFSVSDAMRLASTPAGKQLLALLQQKGGNELNAAMAEAASGNYDRAKLLLSAIMENPEAKALLNQLGR